MITAESPSGKASAKVETEAQYIYELRSINLMTLLPDEQASVIDRFTTFLEGLSNPIAFWVVDDKREVDALGATYPLTYKRFFIESRTQIDSLIGTLATNMVKVPSVPKLKAVSTLPEYVVLDDGRFAQTYNVTRLGGQMYPGFLSNLYPIVHSLRTEIWPIGNERARRIARKYALSVDSGIILRRSEGKSIDPDDQVRYERAEGASQLIARGQERLFKVRVNATILCGTYDELTGTRKEFKQAAGSLGLQTDSPKYLQKPLLTGNGPEWATGRRFYAITSTVANFFPFTGLDVVDPGGVFLGQNRQTGNAILYDLFDKESYDVSVMGTKGFGKSTWVKTFFARMLLADPNVMCFILDSIVKPEYGVGPDGKFDSSFAAVTGCAVHRFNPEKGAGLDPFAVFLDKTRVADFIASLAKIEGELKLLTDLRLAVRDSSNVDELMTKSSGDLKRTLEASLPPYMFLFKGELEVKPRMVFVLYDLPPGELRDAAAFLTLTAIWRKIQDLPVATKKLLVVDEAWALVEVNPRTGKPFFPMAVEFVPEIVSTCRHYNTSFVLATQLVSDMMGRGGAYGPGRRAIESCETKIILKQDSAASEILANDFKLSDRERRFVTSAKPGEGVLITKDGHVEFYNSLSPMEARLFTTRPKDVTG